MANNYYYCYRSSNDYDSDDDLFIRQVGVMWD